MIAYTVTCTFNSPAVCEEWIAWLRDEHLAAVIEAGALDAEVVRFDVVYREAGPPSGTGGGGGGAIGLVKCLVRYHFASRQAFAAYERDHAPRLRADGLKLFPPARGLTYERSLGEVCARS